MIRKFESKDLDSIMEIWINENIRAHKFISRDYWLSNYKFVRDNLPNAKVYVYESFNKILGFIGLRDNYIEGIFVDVSVQSIGIGSKLLNNSKKLYDYLQLSVYQKNNKAVNFYINQDFKIIDERKDDNTGEIEYLMQWNCL